MTRIIEDDIEKAGFYQFYPSTVAVVISQAKKQIGGLAIAWNCGVSFDPPYISISISPKRHTYKLIKESKEFTVNFLPFDEVFTVAAFGRLSGKDLDKINLLKVELEESKHIKTPVLKKAYAAYECKVKQQIEAGDHILIVAEVLAVHYDDTAFNKDNNTLNPKKVTPVLYLGADTYLKITGFEIEKIDRKVVEERLKIKK